MIKYLFQFTLLLFLGGISATTLRFHGNRLFSEAALSELFSKTSDAKIPSGLPALIKLYHQAGYLSCMIDTEWVQDTCKINIQEGPQARFSGLKLTGNSRISSDTLLILSDVGNIRLFSEKKVSEILESILLIYEERGFPFADIFIEGFTVDSSGVLISLNIHEGLKYFFGEIFLPDTLKTKPATLKRLINIETKSVFCASKLKTAQQRLIQCGLFDDIDEPDLLPRPGTRLADVRFHLTETPVSSAEGMLGYKPDKDARRNFSGYLNLDLKNLGGTLRALKLNYLKEFPLTNADLYYREPWILNSQADGELFFTFRIDEENYTSIEIKSRISYPVTEMIRIYAGLSRTSSTYKQFQGADTSLVTESTTGSHIGAVFDKRDFPENPRQGFYVNIPLSIGIKSGPLGHYNEFRPEAILEAYANPAGSHVLASSLHYSGLVTGDTTLHLSELIPLGGASSVRGYRESQFYGHAVLAMRNEYRYLLGRRGRGLLFCDLGVSDPDSPRLRAAASSRNLLIGYGAGLFIRTAAGYAGIDYGLGRGDVLTEGKLHLILKNTF